MSSRLKGGHVKIYPKPKPQASEQTIGSQIPTMAQNNAVYFHGSSIRSGRTPDMLQGEYISHIFYAAARVNDDGSVALSDPEVDQGGLRACTAHRQTNPQLKVILSIGGPSRNASGAFAMIAGDRTKRIRCAYTARQLVEYFGLDGVDIDWENLLDQMSCNSYLQLLAEMRTYFPRPYTLSSVLSADALSLRNLDLKTASHFLDLINLMSYDFAGPWDSAAGHASQVRRPAVITDANAHCTTVMSALRYYITDSKVHPSKIMLGIPTFGRSFLGATTAGDAYKSFGGQGGIIPYAALPSRHSTEEYDSVAQAAYCKGGEGGFVTYDNPHSICDKALLVKKCQLAGLFFTDGSLDHVGDRSIIKAGYLNLSGG